jgi:hypothetical protein
MMPRLKKEVSNEATFEKEVRSQATARLISERLIRFD